MRASRLQVFQLAKKLSKEMTRQGLIEYLTKKYQENEQKQLDLDKRRLNGEFKSDDYKGDMELEKLKGALTDEYFLIIGLVDELDLTDYFCDHIYENPEYNLEYEWEKLNNQ